MIICVLIRLIKSGPSTWWHEEDVTNNAIYRGERNTSAITG